MSQPVQVSGLSDVVELSARIWHTCARTGTGEVWCWGYNWSGQLGPAVGQISTTPVQVTDTEYDGTWYITAAFGLGEKFEIAGRLSYVWNCLSRESVEGRQNLSGGENDNDDGFSEAGLYLKYGTNPGEGNLISGNQWGVYFQSPSTENLIEGNLIGTGDGHGDADSALHR